MDGARSRSASRRARSEYAENAIRFLNGTPNVPAMYSARSGYEIVREIGVGQYPREVAAADPAADGSGDEAGFPVRTCRNPERRGGVVIDVPDGKR